MTHAAVITGIFLAADSGTTFPNVCHRHKSTTKLCMILVKMDSVIITLRLCIQVSKRVRCVHGDKSTLHLLLPLNASHAKWIGTRQVKYNKYLCKYTVSQKTAHLLFDHNSGYSEQEF